MLNIWYIILRGLKLLNTMYASKVSERTVLYIGLLSLNYYNAAVGLIQCKDIYRLFIKVFCMANPYFSKLVLEKV